MRQVAIFVGVGTVAAATHLGVVAFLVTKNGLAPLVANVIGFCVAFLVSFCGHSRFTFPMTGPRLRAARVKFFVVACAGFVLNQAAYASALDSVGQRLYLPTLALVLVVVSAATFLLSKVWAFAQPTG